MTSTAVRPSSVAVPNEHGGWSLTLEPAILGLLVAPGLSGVLLTIAGVLAFMIRAPLKVSLGDRLRHRMLDRTRLADRFIVAYLLGLTLLVAGAWWTARAPFWVPLVAAAPAAAVGVSFDVRSRSRRLVAELAGSIAIASVGAAVVLAGGGSMQAAFGVWAVATARVVASVPHVRVQLRRAKGQAHHVGSSDAAQLAALTIVGTAAAIDLVPPVAFLAVAAVAAAQVVVIRLKPPTAAVLGATQTVLGLAVVLTAGLAWMAP